MFEWLQNSGTVNLDLPSGQIAARLAIAAIAGLIVAAIAHFAHGHRKADAPMLLATLVLLTLLIAMVTLVIGNSVARAFGLVGALSIVRFRTVVDDTRDTAFVIFAVIVGMAIGAGTFMVPVVGVPLVGLVAIALDRFNLSGSTPPTHTLVIRLGLGRDPATTIDPILDRHLASRTITATATVKQGVALDITYAVTLNGPDTVLPQLVAELNQVDGVQSAELHRR